MLICGHVGLTLGLVRCLSQEVDARWVAVVALLPDVLDKSLRYLIAPAFTHGNTRTVGHSLTAVLVGIAVLAFPLRRVVRGARLVALGLPTHLLLDGMWRADVRVSLLWPWLGSDFPSIDEVGLSGLWAHLLRNVTDPGTLVGECSGFLVLVCLWHWCGLGHAAQRACLWRHGVLVLKTPPPEIGAQAADSTAALRPGGQRREQSR